MIKRSVKKSVCSLFLLAIPGILTGCWDALDIDDRDICTAVVVDRQGDILQFYVEIPNISSNIQKQESDQSGGQGISTAIVKGEGKTFAEARISLDTVLNKPLYLGAVQSLILTEALADSGIEEYALRVRQLTDYRKTMDVIVTPDKPKDFLCLQPENEATVGFAIEDTLESAAKLGITYHMSLAELLQKMESRNPCYLLNTLAVREGQISLIGSAVFDGGKRVGYIPFEESRGITLLTAQKRVKPRFDYVAEMDGLQFTLETTLKRRSIKAQYDGVKPSYDVKLHFDAINLYPSGRIRITNALCSEIGGKLKEQITNQIYRTIETSQKTYGCDYLSFSEPFRISYPEAYNAMNWHEVFKEAVFKVDVSVKVIPNRSVDYDPQPVIP